MSQRVQFRDEAEQVQGARYQHAAPPSQRQDSTERVAETSPVQRFGTTEPRVWWQEEINGVRGVPKTAALSLGLIYTLHAFLMPLSALVSNTVVRFASANGQDVGLHMASLVSYWLLPLNLLPAVVAGYVLTRIVPRNAVRGAALAGAIQVLLALLSFVLYFFSWPSNGSASLRPYPLVTDFVLRPILFAALLVLATMGFAWYARYKRSRER